MSEGERGRGRGTGGSEKGRVRVCVEWELKRKIRNGREEMEEATRSRREDKKNQYD